MNNKLGHKITSLTLMTIMFAGGMTVGVAGFMPTAVADFSATDGMLTVSSTWIQGGAILEVVVNDPAWSDTSVNLGDGPTVDFQGVEYILSQGVDGKWYGYRCPKLYAWGNSRSSNCRSTNRLNNNAPRRSNFRNCRE